MQYLELFRQWKQHGGGTPWTIEAKAADALFILNGAWKSEEKYDEK